MNGFMRNDYREVFWKESPIGQQFGYYFEDILVEYSDRPKELWSRLRSFVTCRKPSTKAAALYNMQNYQLDFTEKRSATIKGNNSDGSVVTRLLEYLLMCNDYIDNR